MRKKVLFISIIVLGIFLLVDTNCKTSSETEPPPDNGGDPLKTLTVTSTAFAHGGKIPQKYTCNGENDSPPLSWGNVPAGTKSFAVIMNDETRGYVHMVLFDLPPNITGLPEDINNNLPAGAQFGQNDSKSFGYFGPCPPVTDTNSYYFEVYALDTLLNLNADTDSPELMNAMNGHILAWGELLGIYR